MLLEPVGMTLFCAFISLLCMRRAVQRRHYFFLFLSLLWAVSAFVWSRR